MSRGDGFPIADMSVHFLDDPKVRRLVRAHGAAAACVAIVAYEATLWASWEAGERVDLMDACPLWIEDPETMIERLSGVGLLDAEGRVPQEAWNGWFTPAYERREARREAGQRGGNAKASLQQRHGNAKASLQQAHGDALPDPNVSEPNVSEPNISIAREGDRDSLDRFYELTLRRPWGAPSGEWLRAMEGEYGIAAVVAALEAEWASKPEPHNLIGRMQARLDRDADKAKQEAKARRPAKRSPTAVDRRAELQEFTRLMKEVPNGRSGDAVPDATSAD
jgi:hypothetical protein